ncbi:MAG: acetoacetate--CoA ligase, partial [Bacteroidia bacterium]|nr:acetoacetate--CoA ligase [Bacteroidia bacterium]
MNQQVLWTPSRTFQRQSNLTDYIDWLAKHHDLRFRSYDELWQWSCDQVADFWETIWQYFEVIQHDPYDQVMSSMEMPGVRWFEGATLNYAEHLFRHRSNDRPALIFQNENGQYPIMWDTLENQVRAVRQHLISKNIGKGDCVAAYLPNIPEAIASFIAANSLGAVWSCCSPDFGVETVIERFSQIEPKMLIAADGYRYNSKAFDRLEQIDQIRSSIPSIQETILVSYLNENAAIEHSTSWDNVINKQNTEPLTFEPVDFNHPIWVLYSSGTTGRPKAITHSHGGVLLEHLKYMTFHNDVKKGENFFWFTTTGWMMWNFLQASMLVGAVPVLYDGSPGYPDMDVLWQMAEELPVHHFGTSAPYLAACMKKELPIKASHDLSSLRSIGSTGAPLAPKVFEWIYTRIKEDLWLCSMSGGTDVCTAFVGGNPLAPVYKGAIQCRSLGCAMHAYDDQGQHIMNSLGEMVIEQPMPSMPIYFWNDEDDVRYRSSYFENYPGKWRHGDWIRIMDNGSLIIQGRSDATLNRKGIRIGTAEIYNVLDKIKGIQDSLILNIEQDDGSDTMPLFVMLAPGQSLDEDLQKSIRTELRAQCSPRHVP